MRLHDATSQKTLKLHYFGVNYIFSSVRVIVSFGMMIVNYFGIDKKATVAYFKAEPQVCLKRLRKVAKIIG
jgi:hypothetical protein